MLHPIAFVVLPAMALLLWAGFALARHIRDVRATRTELRTMRAALEPDRRAPPPPRSRAADTARGTTSIDVRAERPDPWAREELRRQMDARISVLAAGARIDGARGDGYRNELTGIGHWLRDKTFGGRQFGLEFDLVPVSNVEAELRWRGSDLGHRIVEVIPDEMLRAGFEVSIQPSPEDEEEPDDVEESADAFPSGGEEGAAPVALLAPQKPPPGPIEMPDDEGPEIVEALDGLLDELEADEAWEKALRYERAFGGAVVFPVIDDGETDLTKKLDPTRIRAVRGINVFTGGWDGEAVVWSYYVDPRSPKYGKPEIYMIRNTGTPITTVPVPGATTPPPLVVAETLTWIHESRLIVLDGSPVTNRSRVQMRGWGDSVFTRVDRVLQQYDQTWGAVANLMTDWAQGVLKMQGLQDALSVNPDLIVDRAADMAMTRSIARAIVIGGDEEFKRETTSLAGVPEMLAQFWLRLAAAADMPLSLLVGQVKGGLGDAGSTDMRFFYDRVAARQQKFKRKLRTLLRWLLLSKEGPTGGVEPARWTIKFAPLYQPTEKEIADTRKVVADTDAVYIQQGVVTPEEIAASRFGGSEWSMETTIDFEGREKMARDAELQKAERAKAMLASASAQPPGEEGDPAGADEPASRAPEPEEKPEPAAAGAAPARKPVAAPPKE